VLTGPVAVRVTFETVSRTFTKLKTLGLIEPPQSNRVKLIGIGRLGGQHARSEDCELAEGDHPGSLVQLPRSRRALKY
jgi:hypothetical protein